MYLVNISSNMDEYTIFAPLPHTMLLLLISLVLVWFATSLGHCFNCISSSSSITGYFFVLAGVDFFLESVVWQVLAMLEINKIIIFLIWNNDSFNYEDWTKMQLRRKLHLTSH